MYRDYDEYCGCDEYEEDREPFGPMEVEIEYRGSYALLEVEGDFAQDKLYVFAAHFDSFMPSMQGEDADRWSRLPERTEEIWNEIEGVAATWAEMDWADRLTRRAESGWGE
jgi:hypothetical protein